MKHIKVIYLLQKDDSSETVEAEGVFPYDTRRVDPDLRILKELISVKHPCEIDDIIDIKFPDEESPTFYG